MKLRPKSSDGSSALHDFLQNYRRITIVEACEYRIDEQDASNIAIWVKESGRWRKLRDVEQRLQRVQFQHDKSACQSIITALFDLSYSQYRTMRESFEQTGFTDAGIYVRDDEDATKPEFVIAVELPNGGRAMGSKAVSGGIGTATGLALGVAGTLTSQYFLNRKSDVVTDDSSDNSDEKQGALASLGSEAISELSSSVRRQSELIEKQSEQLKTAQMEKNALLSLVNKNRYAQSQIDIDNERLRKQVQNQAALLDIIGPIERRRDEIMTKKLDRVREAGQEQINERNAAIQEAYTKNPLMTSVDRLRFIFEKNKLLDPDVVVADMKNIFQKDGGNFLFLNGALSQELATVWFEAYWFQILRSLKQNRDKNIQDLMNIAKNKMKVDVPLLLMADDARTAVDNYMKKLTLEYYFGVMEQR